MKDSSRNYYDVLGVAPTARLSEIKQAFRQLARRYHPDLHPNDRSALETFQEISHIYHVLSNPVSRQQYDQSLQGRLKFDNSASLSQRIATEWYQKGLHYSQCGQYGKAAECYRAHLKSFEIGVSMMNDVKSKSNGLLKQSE